MTPYGFFTALGGILSVAWLLRHRTGIGLGSEEFWVAVWLMLAGAIVGAKALFVLLGWEHFSRGELRFWSDFRTGFVFFGGFAGAVIVASAFARVRGLSFLRGADYFAVAIPLGHAVGRVGCFFQGCCGGHPPHPVQLYESAGLLLIAIGARRVLSLVQETRLPRGTVFAAYLAAYGALRLGLDPLREDGRPERWMGLSHQQWIALLLTLAGGFGLWMAVGISARPRSDSSRIR